MSKKIGIEVSIAVPCGRTVADDEVCGVRPILLRPHRRTTLGNGRDGHLDAECSPWNPHSAPWVPASSPPPPSPPAPSRRPAPSYARVRALLQRLNPAVPMSWPVANRA